MGEDRSEGPAAQAAPQPNNQKLNALILVARLFERVHRRKGGPWPPMARLLAYAIAGRMGKLGADRRFESWPGVETLAEDMGASVTTVKDNMRHLCRGEFRIFEHERGTLTRYGRGPDRLYLRPERVAELLGLLGMEAKAHDGTFDEPISRLAALGSEAMSRLAASHEPANVCILASALANHGEQSQQQQSQEQTEDSPSTLSENERMGDPHRGSSRDRGTETEHGSPASDVVAGAEAVEILGPDSLLRDDGRSFEPWLTGPKGGRVLAEVSREHGANCIRALLENYASGDENEPGGWARSRGMSIYRFLTVKNVHTAARQWRTDNAPRLVPPYFRPLTEDDDYDPALVARWERERAERRRASLEQEAAA